MKKSVKAFLLIIIVTMANVSFTQEINGGQTKVKAKQQITFCNVVSEDSEFTMNYGDLGKCEELLPIDKNLKIKYFILSYKAGGGVYVDMKNSGGKFSKEVKDFLNICETKNIEGILIEARAIDGTAEKKLNGLKIHFRTPNVTFCNALKPYDKIKYSDLVKCFELMQPYEDSEIKSFHLVLFKVDSTTQKGTTIDFLITGSKLRKNFFEDYLKTLGSKKLITISFEKIKVFRADGKTERKVKGIDIKLE